MKSLNAAFLWSLFFEEKVFAGGLIGGESAFAGQETKFFAKVLAPQGTTTWVFLRLK